MYNEMINEIPYDEFLEDIRRQREGKIEEPSKEPWELNREALSRSDYDRITRHGRHNLKRPRPVWLSDKERWTVGAPVNPVEWQILILSDPARGRSGKRVTKKDVERAMMETCGWFKLRKYTFSKCVSRLGRKRLLKLKGGFRRSRIVDKWWFPDLTGGRAGGEWHRKAVHDYVDLANRAYSCYTYADRGYCPGVEMPDVITVRPRLAGHTARHDLRWEPLEWDMENPVYAEFKSAEDMRNNPSRLKNQLERYEGVPLYLRVEARIGEARDMIEEHGRRNVGLLDLLREPEGDMVYLCGNERPWIERSFEPVLEKIKRAFRETYDREARLRKTGTDPQGRECHDLILYDKLGTAKNVGQVIPNFAGGIGEFVEFFFDGKHLGRITTADYIYVPERKPTYENKTWKWEKRKTRGSRFRSFSG